MIGGLSSHTKNFNFLQSQLRGKSWFSSKSSLHLQRKNSAKYTLQNLVTEKSKTSFRLKEKYRLKLKMYKRPKALQQQWQEFREGLSAKDQVSVNELLQKLSAVDLEESGQKLLLKISAEQRAKVISTSKFLWGSSESLDQTASGQSELADVSSHSQIEIQVNLKLFFSLASRVSSTVGEDEFGRFLSATNQVNMRYHFNFNLKVLRVGSYLESSEKALDIDPAAFNSFVSALSGVLNSTADNHDLDEFLAAADDYFNSLKSSLPEAGDALETAKQQIITQVTDFFGHVTDIISRSPLPLNPILFA